MQICLIVIRIELGNVVVFIWLTISCHLGETFEYSMKEKSMASVKVLKAYALEVGVPENQWDEGVNKAVDKFYGSKFDEDKTNACHEFVNSTVPNGEDRVKKVVQTLY